MKPRRRLGFDYAAETRRASRGDAKALQRFFQLAQEADGAAAESITGVPTVVYHLLGDEKFARFLAAQSLADQGDDAERYRPRWSLSSDDSLSAASFSGHDQNSLSS